jgi:hypothetical protein
VRNIASKNTIMRNGIAGDAVVFVRSGTVVISERERARFSNWPKRRAFGSPAVPRGSGENCKMRILDVAIS